MMQGQLSMRWVVICFGVAFLSLAKRVDAHGPPAQICYFAGSLGKLVPSSCKMTPRGTSCQVWVKRGKVLLCTRGKAVSTKWKGKMWMLQKTIQQIQRGAMHVWLSGPDGSKPMLATRVGTRCTFGVQVTRPTRWLAKTKRLRGSMLFFRIKASGRDKISRRLCHRVLQATKTRVLYWEAKRWKGVKPGDLAILSCSVYFDVRGTKVLPLSTSKLDCFPRRYPASQRDLKVLYPTSKPVVQ